MFLLLVCIIYYRELPLVIAESRILKQYISVALQPEEEKAPIRHSPSLPCLMTPEMKGWLNYVSRSRL